MWGIEYGLYGTGVKRGELQSCTDLSDSFDRHFRLGRVHRKSYIFPPIFCISRMVSAVVAGIADVFR